MVIKTIHFIEDSDDEIFLARLLFETEQIDIDIVHHKYHSTFESFLQLHGIEENSLILVDMNMPKKRGDNALRELLQRDELANAIIGMCSGSEDPADKKNAMDAGAAFFAQKPLNLKCLKSICDQVENLFCEEKPSGEVVLVRRNLKK